MQTTGIISDIQHYSLQDGPGVRTTIFMKGCPLRCGWCHNPETWSHKTEVWYTRDKCAYCGQCASVCPTGALTMSRSTLSVDIDRRICKVDQGCTACASVCQMRAMEICGERKTPQECMVEVLRDRPFYQRSGGGTCISGGEPTMQIDFTEEFLWLAKQRYLHTSIETCAHCKWENFERIMPYTDLFLIDIKNMDPIAHWEGTGVTNELILENIARLAERGKKIRIRVPVVPEFNDSEDNIAETAAFMAKHGIKSIDLLPFHNTATGKYAKLQLMYAYAHIRSLPPVNLRNLLRLCMDYGINGTIGGVDIPRE